MSPVILFVGCLFLLAGVAYLAYLLNVPETYAMGSVLVLLCLGAIAGAPSARRSRI
ncbi:MAG: hypothetical protein NVSMB62_27340 [Acidobacteriaceae bacterium]